jgi:hypothetical protein
MPGIEVGRVCNKAGDFIWQQGWHQARQQGRSTKAAAVAKQAVTNSNMEIFIDYLVPRCYTHFTPATSGDKRQAMPQAWETATMG